MEETHLSNDANVVGHNTRGRKTCTIDCLPQETLWTIIEFVYPYVMDEKHAFCLVCKRWKATFDFYQSRCHSFYNLRWPKDDWNVKFDMLDMLLRHILGFEGGGYLNCDVIWKTERLFVNLSKMSSKRAEAIYNYGIGLMEEIAEGVREDLIAAKEKGILLTGSMRELSIKFAMKLSVILFIFRYHSPLKAKAVEIFDLTFSFLKDRPQYDAVLTEAQDAGCIDGVGIKNFIYEDSETGRSLFFRNDDAIVLKSAVLNELVNLSKLYGTNRQNLVLINYGQYEIDFEVFEEARAFCAHDFIEPLKEIGRPLRSTNLFDLVQPWYAHFADRKPNQTMDFIVFGHSLHIVNLISLFSAKLAAMITEKDPEEINRMFVTGDDDWTPEERAQIEEDNSWVLEP